MLCYSLSPVNCVKTTISPDVNLICKPLDIKKGKSGVLPVTTSKHVTWDSVTWKVLDKSDSELLKGSCQTACDNLFNFKVDRAGVHKYTVEMINGGDKIRCDSRLSVIGKISCRNC